MIFYRIFVTIPKYLNIQLLSMQQYCNSAMSGRILDYLKSYFKVNKNGS